MTPPNNTRDRVSPSKTGRRSHSPAGISEAVAESEKKSATRDGFGEGLLELGELDERVVVLTADVAESTRVLEFAKRWPDRFVECGVAEQNMMGIAAGLSACGKIPFIAAYAVFSPGRNWDQLRVSVAYSNLNVKIVGAHAGLSTGPDGATHQGLEDIALTRVLPNMTVVVPGDARQAKQATLAAATYPGPVYLRLTRGVSPVFTDQRFEIGKADVVWNSEKNGHSKIKVTNQVAITGCGPVLALALEAVRELDEEGIGTMLINCHTVKPLDQATILTAAKWCGAMVTVEEHQLQAGFGSAIAELLAGNYPVPVEMIGISDSFGESGQAEELAERYGITKERIKEAVIAVIRRKIQNGENRS